MKICKHENMRLVFVKIVTILVDYISIVFGLLAAYQLRLSLPETFVSLNFKIDNIYIYGIVPIIFLIVFLLNNSYDIEMPLWDKTKSIVRSITIGVVVSIVLMYTGHVTNSVSRLFVGFSYISIIVLVTLFRFITHKVLNTLGILYIPVLLVKKSLDRMPISYYKIIGFVDDNPKSESLATTLPCLGRFLDVERVIQETGVQNVLVCAPGLDSKQLVKLINQLQLLVRKVSFVPDIFGIPASNISARGLMEEQAIVVRVQNNLAKKSNRIIKRIFDIVATVCGGILILPILAIVAILIYIDSPGPIVFGHKRVGQGGKEFPCYKFRSMVPNAQEALEVYLKENPAAREEWERDFKLKDDPRVTRIGKFLRKTSLDELPQLWNVLVGDMSLVGPRPIVRDEIVKYGDYINDFYLVPPGITGVWQVSGRSDTTYEERVLMDSWYVHNWSVWIDIVYLLKTVLAVVKSKGAY